MAFEEDSCKLDALDGNVAVTVDESDWIDELNILDVSVEIVEMMVEESGWVAYLYAGEEQVIEIVACMASRAGMILDKDA